MKRQSHSKIRKQIMKLENKLDHAEKLSREEEVERLRHEIMTLRLVLGNMVYPYYV